MNKNDEIISLHDEIVLIDTWWNVNLPDTGRIWLLCFSFNRYMVECELSFLHYRSLGQGVLIDTWWNVNV